MKDDTCSNGVCKAPIVEDSTCRSDWDCNDDQYCDPTGFKCVNYGDKKGVCYRTSDCNAGAVCKTPGTTNTPSCASKDNNHRAGRNCGDGVDGCLTCKDSNTACGSCIDSFHWDESNSKCIIKCRDDSEDLNCYCTSANVLC